MGSAPTSAQKKLAWLCVVSLCYYTAVTIADMVAQSIFVGQLGAKALPNIFLLKAGIDVLAALAYLPLTRGRNPQRVWRVLLLFYGVVLAIGWWATTSSIPSAPYILYLGHEVAWTLAVIHWGIFLLSLLGPIQSRRQFPILFGVGRLGALLGGLLVTLLAIPLGTSALLGIVLILAILSGAASLKLQSNQNEPSAEDLPASGTSWREVSTSPLVRTIALSTAAMVMLRYGLRMVSLAEIRSAFHGDKDQIAAFLGLIAVLGNTAAFVLGIWVVPRLLARAGVGAANLLFASTTLIAFVLTWIFPGLASASSARFVEMPLKHALKTPLSVLFYGGQPMHSRAAARSLVFGVAIPVAAVCVGLGFRYGQPAFSLISALGIALSLLYIAVCRLQNKMYRLGLESQLRELFRDESECQTESSSGREALLDFLPGLPPEQQKLLICGLTSSDARASELSHALLGEILRFDQRDKIRQVLQQKPQQT